MSPDPAVSVLVADEATAAVAAHEERVEVIRVDTLDDGLSRARGPLLALLRPGDAFDPGSLRALVEALGAHPEATLAYGDAGHVPAGPRPVGDARGALLVRDLVCPAAMVVRAPAAPVAAPLQLAGWALAADAARRGEALYVPEATGSCDDAPADPRDVVALRRALLTDVDTAAVPADDVLAAWRALELAVADASDRTGSTLAELVPVDALHATAAVEFHAYAAGTDDPADQIRLLVRSLAHDPTSFGARESLSNAARRLALTRAPAETRGSIVLAHAGELSRRPELLAAFVDAFTAADDVTLLIDARGWTGERLSTELLPIAAALGLGDDGPDVLILDDGRPWPAERLRAVLTLVPGTAAAAGVTAAATADELRATVGRVAA